MSRFTDFLSENLLFGYELIKKEEPQQVQQNRPSFVQRENEDGAVVVAASGGYGTYVDLDGTVRSEAELISKYREMALNSEIHKAVDEIINEIVEVEEEETVKIKLDGVNATDPVKDALEESFDEILTLLNFNQQAYNIIRRWYIDGRLYYHIVVDVTQPKNGIVELRYVDPRKIRKVREIIKRPIQQGAISHGGTDASVVEIRNEYYIYNDKGFAPQVTANSPVSATTTGIKIAEDSVAQITSGLTDVNGAMVLSFLHFAIKGLNQLRAIEDASVIYRLARAPERRVWYIDVGTLPKAKAEQYVASIMNKHKNRLTYDAMTGDYRDDRKFMCYALDTLIPLLDGRTLTLEQIMDEYKAGKKNWVYSCDPTTGKFVPGPVSWAGITKTNSQVVRVTFDNGKSVVCTPDHKFPVWNKGFVEAKDLVGESIIPGYRRMKNMHGTTGEYEQIYKNETKTWEYTHREVARWKDSIGLREEMTHSEKHSHESQKTIHHQELSIKTKLRVPKCKTWKIKTPGGEDLIVDNLSAFCRDHDLNRAMIKGTSGSKCYYAEQLRNHKAVSVEWLEDKIDVGCLTVDLDETYHSHHTYLLDAGVYTKNTMLEDYWLPRREGGKGTEVETLPAGENLGEMDDVLYFQKKLYNALNVPVSRLSADDGYSLGRATELSRDEVSFGKFVSRLRNQFAQLFTKLLRQHVSLKQIMSVEEFDRIAPKIKYDFAHDNHFLDLMEDEVFMGKLDLVQAASQWVGRYLSNEYINKHIFRFNDEEIDNMRAQIEEEQVDPIYSQPMPGQMDPMMAGMEGMGPEEMPMDDGSGEDNGPDTYESSAKNQFASRSSPQKPSLPSEQKAQRVKTQQRRDPKRKGKPQK